MINIFTILAGLTGAVSTFAVGVNLKTPTPPEDVLVLDNEGNLTLNLKNKEVKQNIEEQIRIAAKISVDNK